MSAESARTDPEGDALVDSLVQSAFVVTGVLTRVAAEHDVSLTQLRVLGILRDRRPRMAQLAQFLGLEKSTMSGLVDRAERRGLVQRETNLADARAVDVFMTPAGVELAERAHKEVRRALAPTTGRLDDQQRRALTRLLERMLGPPPHPGPPRTGRGGGAGARR
jgi:DNA-binding MarR family transcriptional regulator